MSSRKIVASSIAMAAVLASVVYASSTFPLKAAAGASAARAVQNPPRDRRPGEPGPESTRERELKTTIAGGLARPAQFFELAKLQEARGAMAEAEATLQAFVQSAPGSRDALMTLADFYNRSGQFDRAVAVLEDAAAMTPADPQGYQILATFYWEKAFKDASLSPARKSAYIQAGIDATDRALAANDSHIEALTYKNILLRMKANMETDPASRLALTAEADALRSRAMELSAAKSREAGRAGMAPLPPGVDGLAPVRVGGNIKPPMKVRDVKPIYPADAQQAKVQGVVIIEATIDTAGLVSSARVMRGVPMLDQAAVEAVNQWQFQPTLLNGMAVPVIMTVTVNFSLDREPGWAPPPPPPPPPAELVNGQAPVKIGGNIKPPRKSKDARPNYPADALAARVQGVVILQVTIDQIGYVISTRVLRGQPMLDQAAVEAVNQWRFEPTLLNGVPVPVIMTVTVDFKIDR